MFKMLRVRLLKCNYGLTFMKYVLLACLLFIIIIVIHVKAPRNETSSPPAPFSYIMLEQAAHSIYRLIVKEPITYKCSNIVDFGPDAWFFCNDPAISPANNCLVLSFGINYHYGFDNHMVQRGCEVHSFDPSMATEGKHDPRVKFHPIGISGTDNDSFVPRLDIYVRKKTTWKVKTLASILKDLNRENATIDVLKMDVELSEWPVVRNLLDSHVLSQVKQLVLEWHIFPDAPPRHHFQRMLDVLNDLKAARFALFKKNPGTVRLLLNNLGIQSDNGYVNLRLVKTD